MIDGQKYEERTVSKRSQITFRWFKQSLERSKVSNFLCNVSNILWKKIVTKAKHCRPINQKPFLNQISFKVSTSRFYLLTIVRASNTTRMHKIWTDFPVFLLVYGQQCSVRQLPPVNKKNTGKKRNLISSNASWNVL